MSTRFQAGSGGRGGRVQDGSCWELFWSTWLCLLILASVLFTIVDSCFA